MLTSNSRSTNTNNHTASQNIRQYSQVVQTTMYPKREQAIILNVNENLKLIDYIEAVGNLTQPKDVLFASRISHNRVCIHLSSVKLVDDLINTHETIQIKEYIIGVRRLITPAKRLILSNVTPFIPHDVLEDSIKSLGYKIASPMSFLRVGATNPAYSHVQSHRRQIYILPDENIELPSSIQITHEGLTTRIFLTFDVISCFLCKNTGHTASQCPQQTFKNNLTSTETNSTPITTLNNQFDANLLNPQAQVTNQKSPREIEISQNITQRQTTIGTETLTPSHILRENHTTEDLFLSHLDTRNKRPASSSIRSTIDDTIEDILLSQPDTDNIPNANQTSKDIPLSQIGESAFLEPKRACKKMKKSYSEEKLNDIPNLMKSAEKHINEKFPPYVLNFNQLTHLFENLSGSKDPISLVKTYSEDLQSVLTMLHSVYPFLEHKTLKSRNTRLQKKLRKHINPTPEKQEDSDSEYSVSSQASY